MKVKYLVIIAGFLALLLSSCATTQKDKALKEVKRVGIVNLYQDLPAYSKFTITHDAIGKAELPEMRNYLTQKFVSSLSEVGIQAREVRDHLPVLRGEVDLILELQPRKRPQHDPESGIRYEDAVVDDGSNGFGFYYKSLLLTKTGPEAYVTIQVVTVENKAGSLVPVSEYPVYKREKINRSEIADSWRLLSDIEKQEMESALRQAIDNSVAEVLSKMGF